jgi:hypothetical protein
VPLGSRGIFSALRMRQTVEAKPPPAGRLRRAKSFISLTYRIKDPSYISRPITGVTRPDTGDARSTQRRTSSGNTPSGQPVRGCPWKADGAHRPSQRPDAVRHMSVDTAT